MSVPKDRPQPGPGAPLTVEREQYRRLMAQGMSNHRACLQIGVHPSTGMRWSKGRSMVDHTGKARYYPPIDAEAAATSPRYLSEDSRSAAAPPQQRPQRARWRLWPAAAAWSRDPFVGGGRDCPDGGDFPVRRSRAQRVEMELLPGQAATSTATDLRQQASSPSTAASQRPLPGAQAPGRCGSSTDV